MLAEGKVSICPLDCLMCWALNEGEPRTRLFPCKPPPGWCHHATRILLWAIGFLWQCPLCQSLWCNNDPGVQGTPSAQNRRPCPMRFHPSFSEFTECRSKCGAISKARLFTFALRYVGFGDPPPIHNLSFCMFFQPREYGSMKRFSMEFCKKVVQGRT